MAKVITRSSEQHHESVVAFYSDFIMILCDSFGIYYWFSCFINIYQVLVFNVIVLAS